MFCHWSRKIISSEKLKKVNALVHSFSTRRRGVESQPSKDLNMGFTPLLLPAKTEENRRIFLCSIGAESMALKTVRQVHKSKVIIVNSEEDEIQEGDGLISGGKNILLGILTADCFPLLLAEKNGNAVAALHCGWRSTAGGIIENSIRLFRNKFAVSSCELLAVIGPGIRQCCFEVADELITGFKDKGFNISKYLKPSNQPERYMFDLAGQIKEQLLEAGLKAEHIDDVAKCTCCDSANFFSYRRDGEKAGRLMSVIGIK